MLSAPDPIAFSQRPLPTAVAVANATANRPEDEEIRLLAVNLRERLQPSLTASLPGLGGHLDLYDTEAKPATGADWGAKAGENTFPAPAGEFSQGLSNFEPMATPHDFPYLKPLAGRNLGNLLNTLV